MTVQGDKEAHMAIMKHPDEIRFEAEVKEMEAHQPTGPGPSPHGTERSRVNEEGAE